MTLEAAVAARIDDQVDALTGKIEDVIGLAALLNANELPQRAVAAFVVPLGFDDKGGGESMTGAHTQMLDHAVGVVLVIQALGDAKARGALPKIETLRTDVVAAVAGWAPDDVSGVFRVTKARLVEVVKGVVFFQIDFALTDQLRLLS